MEFQASSVMINYKNDYEHSEDTWKPTGKT